VSTPRGQLCAELKALADDRFDVFGDADRAFALAMGSGARARLPGERFARKALAPRQLKADDCVATCDVRSHIMSELPELEIDV
jgi:hypothetical protein